MNVAIKHFLITQFYIKKIDILISCGLFSLYVVLGNQIMLLLYSHSIQPFA